MSETTRALLGNRLPDGSAVHDLGEQNLKDIQHEHVFELSFDGRPRMAKPLRTDTPKSTFEERVESYVMEQLEASLASGHTPSVPAKLALGGTAVAAGAIVILALAAVVIVLIVKLVL